MRAAIGWLDHGRGIQAERQDIMSEPNHTISHEENAACAWATISRGSARTSLARSVIAGCLLGLLFSLAHSSGAGAQPTTITIGNNNGDLRPVFAKADDI